MAERTPQAGKHSNPTDPQDKQTARVEVHPATPDRWADLEMVFGPSGGAYGCWCMFFRMRRKDFQSRKAAENKRDMKSLVESGAEPGLIAYVDGVPAAWVSLDRRENLPLLVHSTKIKPVDDKPVWSIVCFVVHKDFRRRGLMARLIEAAVDYIRVHGGTTAEAYPIEPDRPLKGDAGYTGIASAFLAAGFREVGRTTSGRPIVRRDV
jgi:GNAT superfamily N-acetyltransferase